MANITQLFECVVLGYEVISQSSFFVN